MRNVVRELEAILSEPYNINIYLVGIKNDNTEYRKLNITNDLANEFKTIAESYLNQFINKIKNDEARVIPYDPGYKKEEFEWEKINLSSNIYSVIREKISSIPVITNTALLDLSDENFLKSLSYYILQIETIDRGKIQLFRKYIHRKKLVKGTGIRAVFNNGAFKSLDERVITFDEKYDCFEYSGIMYISSTTYFHYIFQFYEELANKASEIIDDIVNKIPIENVGELKSLSSRQPAMLAKIYSISRKDYFNEINLDDIQRTIDAFNIGVSIENGKVVFTKDKRWEVLKLLDEDYLDSMMTGNRFVANSKQVLNNS